MDESTSVRSRYRSLLSGGIPIRLCRGIDAGARLPYSEPAISPAQRLSWCLALRKGGTVISSGIDLGTYPTMRTMSVGVDLTF